MELLTIVQGGEFPEDKIMPNTPRYATANLTELPFLE
jgi:hypothetical protein